MRICRIGKRIYVHIVPLDTSWFCPYCCATVDTAFATQIAGPKVEPVLQRSTTQLLRQML
jgi:hypothetical protein